MFGIRDCVQVINFSKVSEENNQNPWKLLMTSIIYFTDIYNETRKILQELEHDEKKLRNKYTEVISLLRSFERSRMDYTVSRVPHAGFPFAD